MICDSFKVELLAQDFLDGRDGTVDVPVDGFIAIFYILECEHSAFCMHCTCIMHSYMHSLDEDGVKILNEIFLTVKNINCAKTIFLLCFVDYLELVVETTKMS